MSIYSNPHTTMRELVSDSIDELSLHISTIDTHMETEINTSVDPQTLPLLQQARSALMGIRMNLSTERDRLNAIVSGWPTA